MSIRCQVITVEEGEELAVASIQVEGIPRVGEFLWFSEKQHGATSWRVTEVAHWVGTGHYHVVALYVEKTVTPKAV